MTSLDSSSHPNPSSARFSTRAHHPPYRQLGITEASLAEVQTQPVTIFAPQGCPNSIVVGQPLESGLDICHPLCIDTALMYHHPSGRPLKLGLAWLTKIWCHREIRTRGEGGHDPEEDSHACVDLLDSQFKTGPDSAGSRPTIRTSLSAWRGVRKGWAGRCESCHRGEWS